MSNLHSIGAMRRAARRRLPRMAFDYIDGGAGRESAMRLSDAAFDAVRMWPRILTGAVERSSAVDLFGIRYSAPFGIAPLGMANLVQPGTDAALALAAARAGIPYALSTAATTSLEEIASVNPNAWFQLYVGRDAHIVDDLLLRAARAHTPVLVVTADVPAPGKRLRDLENGLKLPMRLSPRSLLDFLRHPRWMMRMLHGGLPRFANLAPYADAAEAKSSLAELMARQSSARLDWALLESIRRRWRGPLVLKGVLRTDDAVKAAALGVDGIVVSNHGGRQLDASPAPLDALPRIRARIDSRVKLILDGGVRSGEDVVRGLALGADIVLLGRPFLYAAAALGLHRGPDHLIAQLSDEVDRALAMLGCARLSDCRGLLTDSAQAPAA